MQMAKNKIHSQIPHLNDFLHKSLTLTPLLKSQLQHHRPRWDKPWLESDAFPEHVVKHTTEQHQVINTYWEFKSFDLLLMKTPEISISTHCFSGQPVLSGQTYPQFFAAYNIDTECSLQVVDKEQFLNHFNSWNWEALFGWLSLVSFKKKRWSRMQFYSIVDSK